MPRAARSRLGPERVIDALRRAGFQRVPEPGSLFDSDLGYQRRNDGVQQAPIEHGMRNQMSRKGKRWDSGPSESLWISLKVSG